jgi:hypothetical protein
MKEENKNSGVSIVSGRDTYIDNEAMITGHDIILNKIFLTNASQELKEKLEKLTRQVAEMCGYLPEDKKKEAARDLEVLTDEATSEKPRRKWYSLSAEGLIEAAKAVGEAANPVVKTVKEIITLLELL